MPFPNTTYYPPTGFFFKVAFVGIFGMQEGSFMEVNGLSVSISPEEVKEGGENRFTHRLPSPPKYGNLVLKRGMVIESPLILWAQQCINEFSIKPKTIIVQLLEENAMPIAIWSFFNAYAVKLDYSGLTAKEGQIVIETLELAYDFFEKTL
ncbi:phage tail protein [Chitinophaga sancti]|uniref:phage tail protein n=1 Tax=Chitinophaga sancti TaxID=1004 RepID=UPI002A750EB6|nr:phage tail protein [Chitinophaga sancti]WPQ60894.1 phage tail protein [Chitinophaga sancti]